MERFLTETLNKAGIAAGKREIILSARYLTAVWDANRYLNLTAAGSLEELATKHFIDSLYLIKTTDFKETELLDLGTGAGFPGIPLKIFNKNMYLHLMDSVRRKLSFIKYTANILGIDKINYLHGRAESYGRHDEHREQYQCVCSRAVAKMPLLLEIGMPLVKTGGNLIVYKGPGGEEELKKSEGLIDKLGGELKNNIIYELPGGEKRAIYIIKKRKPAPFQYPRKKLKKLH